MACWELGVKREREGRDKILLQLSLSSVFDLSGAKYHLSSEKEQSRGHGDLELVQGHGHHKLGLFHNDWKMNPCDFKFNQVLVEAVGYHARRVQNKMNYFCHNSRGRCAGRLSINVSKLFHHGSG